MFCQPIVSSVSLAKKNKKTKKKKKKKQTERYPKTDVPAINSYPSPPQFVSSRYAMFLSTDKMTPAPLENSTGTITPPLTRPPSLENAGALITSSNSPWNDTGALITSSNSPWSDDEAVFVRLPPQPILDFDVPSPPPPLPPTAHDDNPAASSPWLPEIVAALMLAFKFLLAPLGAMGRRRECRRENAGHDEPGDTGDARDPPRSSVWEDMKDAAEKMLGTARSSLRAVAGRIDDLFDNPDARRDRLVKLASAFQVFDMSARHGHERHDSGQLIEVDRTRLTPERDVSMGVQMVCRQACAMFPEVGYNQVRKRSSLHAVLFVFLFFSCL